jgi:hypothetical protein
MCLKYEPKRGSHHFPEYLDYEYCKDSNFATIRWCEKATESYKNNLRMLDCWGLAYIEFLKSHQDNLNPRGLRIEIKNKGNINTFTLEMLRRRVSFLNFNDNLINVELIIENKEDKLYSKDNLYNRPENEIIHQDIPDRSFDDKPGRLEKDLQAFISRVKDNRRLAYFGSDFYKMKKKYGLIREFATGVFTGQVKESTRILPTNFVDFVSFNKYRKLSIIELKINDSKLEAISQLLDYAIYFAAYRSQLNSLIIKKIGKENCPSSFIDHPIVGYLVNNYFHPKFGSIKKYYKTDPKKDEFSLRQVTLGRISLI